MSRIGLHNYEAFLLDYIEGNLDAEALGELKLFLLAHPELDIDLNEHELPYLSPNDQTADPIVTGFKNSLKKKENELPDEMLLNYLEGNLGTEERNIFERKLSRDKELVKDLENYKKTILSPDAGEIAEFKSELHKTEDDLALNDRLIAYVENQLDLIEKSEVEKELILNTALQREFSLVSKTVLVADTTIAYADKENLKKEGRIIALFSFRTLGSIAAAIFLLIGLAFLYNYSTSKEEVKGGLASKPNFRQSTTTRTPYSEKALAKVQRQSAKTISSSVTKQVIQATKEAKSQPEQTVENPIENYTQGSAAEMNPLAENDEKSTKMPVTTEQKSDLAVVDLKKENGDSVLSKQNFLALEDIGDEGGSEDMNSGKGKGFWKRAVYLAKQANKLGVKSVDGQEDSKNRYRLSFNAFSVEKK